MSEEFRDAGIDGAWRLAARASGRTTVLEGFTAWLESTELSATLSDPTRLGTWLIIPASQCVHIVGVAAVVVSTTILNLRMLGIGPARQSTARLSAHVMPWIWSALIVLFLTGVVQTIAEPARELPNAGFRTKMAMVIAAVAIAMVFENTLRKDPNYWERSPERRAGAKLLAGASLALWIGIVAAGRLIAYLGEGPAVNGPLAAH